MISTGNNYSGSPQVFFECDLEAAANVGGMKAHANIPVVPGKVIGSYSIDQKGKCAVRPFAFIASAPNPQSGQPVTPATAQVMLDDDGAAVRVVHGPQPLWGSRRGEDVMMSDVLAFDLRVYDPGAPLFASVKTPATSGAAAVLDVVLTPSDPGWRGTPGPTPGSAPNGSDGAYLGTDNMGSPYGIGGGGSKFAYVGQGAYVDLGYGFDDRFKFSPNNNGLFPQPKYSSQPGKDFSSSAPSWFFNPRGLSDVYGNLLAPGFCVYDTWSFHYENNGIDEDGALALPAQQWRKIVDQAVDGMDNDGALGVDDVGERETSPPYDKPLRGMQAIIRTYERDSRSIRQVRVNQHFMPE
jgi:hypothetical protein